MAGLFQKCDENRNVLRRLELKMERANVREYYDHYLDRPRFWVSYVDSPGGYRVFPIFQSIEEKDAWYHQECEDVMYGLFKVFGCMPSGLNISREPNVYALVIEPDFREDLPYNRPFQVNGNYGILAPANRRWRRERLS